MSVGQEMATYLAAAAPCFLTVGFLLRWARPVNGDLSPRLQRPGMETLVVAVASAAALLGLAFTIGAILEPLK
jgi:hypothetical protein